ncbi:hypothetical protein Vafri_5246, partial [Volvox africanus]
QLELGAQLSRQSKALLLLRELEQVRALAHDSSSTSWHLKDLLLLGLPGNNVELLLLSLAEQTASAATEDWAGSVGVQRRRSPDRLLSDRSSSCSLLGANHHAATSRPSGNEDPRSRDARGHRRLGAHHDGHLYCSKWQVL